MTDTTYSSKQIDASLDEIRAELAKGQKNITVMAMNEMHGQHEALATLHVTAQLDRIGDLIELAIRQRMSGDID